MPTYPISRIRAKSFGPFKDIDVELTDGLNVIVGDNATGKSQLLKLMYSCTKAVKDSETLTKRDLSGGIASKLIGVFRPQRLGRLTRRTQGRAKAEVSLKYAGIADPLEFSFSSPSSREVTIGKMPDRPLTDEPVLLPTHELLTLASSFLGLYSTYDTGFEETWKDTTELLLRPALLGPRGNQANAMLEPFSNLLQGGTVVEEGGEFYLKQPGVGTIEAPLLAEGHRKLAMLVRLISNGVLLEGGYLFWDEPEANLNPASQRAIAHALVHLANHGTQIVVATHSMFLLREIQMSSEEISPRFIGLNRQQDSEQPMAAAQVVAQTSDDLDDLDYIAALEAEVEQANRYLGW